MRDCPRCRSRLIAPSEVHVVPVEQFAFVPQNVGTSAASRALAGGAVTLGLVMGFREILAGLLPFIGESESWWQTEFAFVVLMVVRAVAALGGGILAGAGRENALKSGLLAGATAAAILLALQMFEPGGKVTAGSVIAAGITLLIAAMAGSIGGRIWPPRTELPKANRTSRGSSILEKAKDLQQQEEAKKIRPTQWVRIVLGVSLTICGFVGAEGLRNVVARTGDGMIDLGGARNVPFSCLQIAGVIAMLGGVATGAGTGAGFRHGVFAGLIAGGIAAGIYGLRGPEKLKVAVGLLEVLDWPPDKTPPVRAVTAIFGAGFVVLSVAGLFGGLLFPPMVVRPKVGRDADIGKPVTNFG